MSICPFSPGFAGNHHGHIWLPFCQGAKKQMEVIAFCRGFPYGRSKIGIQNGLPWQMEQTKTCGHLVIAFFDPYQLPLFLGFPMSFAGFFGLRMDQ